MNRDRPHLVRHAYEVYGDPAHVNQLVITCEHASRRVPEPLRASPEDRVALDSHWGWDIGAREVVRELVRLKGCVAILARFSRLVIDANRRAGREDLVRRRVQGHVLTFNADLDERELRHRVQTLHEPYHRAIETLCRDRLAAGADVVLFSVHSFTPALGEEVRAMELGVLFDSHDAVAGRFAGHLDDAGFRVALNQPYSGREGLMFAARRHGLAHGSIYLELEIRQDLLPDRDAAREIARRIEPALTRLQVRHRRR